MANTAVNTAKAASSFDGNAPVRPGQILEGKFKIERVVGEGAMGMVLEATHLELEERVALKFLREEAKARPEIAQRFAREARASSKIKNDHVARVYDVGTHEGSPFIVMEYLEGQDLEAMLEKRGALDPTTAVEYVIQACEGLTAAHVQGVVHRDIKPGNLFLTEHGGINDIKVLDFGISKAGVKKGTLDDVDLVTGETTQIMGSPHYMSPEQIRSTKDVDSRADIWSLGVVLYELVTNTPPFDGGEVTSLIAQVLHEPHRSARAIVANVPTGLEEVIDRCLEKDPAKRYQHAAELAVALLPFAPKRSRAVAERAMTMMQRATGQHVAFDSLPPPPVPSSGPHSGMRPSGTGSNLPAFVPQQPVPSRAPPPAQTRGAMPWIALVAIVLGLGGGAFALFTRLQGAPPKPTPVAAEPVATPATPAQEVTPPVTAAAAPPVVSAAPVESAKVEAAKPEPAKPAVAPVAKQPMVIAPTPKPKASAPPAAPVNTESEIRHER